MDFYKITERGVGKDGIEVYPDFKNKLVGDLLVRGMSFYAVWNEETGLWSTDILDVQRKVDKELYEYVDNMKKERGGFFGPIKVKTMESDSSGVWKRFKQYLKEYPDTKVRLDEKLTFANTEVKKKDYVSKRLPYALEEGDYSAWDKLVGTLYDPSEREKIEWSIGAIVSGDSKTIQKFCVFYGEAGTGKSTIINIIQKLFDGYYVTFDAKALGSSSNQFATEAFRSDPLVAIQHDGDLSRIEDNTRINSIVSHEMMTIKEKYKPEYMSRANCFLFLGTNRPVKITDAKSGIIRRLIDITPSGRLLKPREYDALMSQIDFQLGAIAWHCLEVYRELGKNYYKNYTPKDMIMKTDVFYNFVEANQDIFEEQKEGMSLKQAYSMYKEYCEDALVEFKLPKYKFREELKNYFERFEDRAFIDGKYVRNWYSGFRAEKMEAPVLKKEEHSLPLVMDCTKSLLDDILADCPAQYGVDDGNGNEKPELIWSEVTTVLRDINTKKVHYVRVPKEHIVIDFDLKNDKGEKDILKNAEAASKWPTTYAEFSKGGKGIHLHYIYDGDVGKLASVYSDGIEIKVFRGKAALRRRLSKCNDIPVAHLAEGSLPLKEEKMIDTAKLNDELHLRNIIKKCLRKENHGATRPEVDLIAKVLDDAYKSGMSYDVGDMEHDILVFAMNSTHQSDYCIKKLREMKFESKDVEEAREASFRAEQEKVDKAFQADPGKFFDAITPIVFYDIEVFPNLLLVNWKKEGPDEPVHRLINPKPRDLEELFKVRLVDFNGRKYDRHILYHRYLGNTIESCYDLSQRIIVEGAQDAFYPEAYSIGYTDVYDFCSKKQSLKKWEIELGIHHQELGLPFDQPVSEDLWEKVAEYCDNDVIATEAVWNARQADFVARQILADIAGGTVNDTTNQLSTKFIFGDNRHPQDEFEYRFMGDESDVSDIFDNEIKRLGCDPEYTKFNSKGKPIFPGYTYTATAQKDQKSWYRGEYVGEGGYVYANPGIHFDIPTQDVSGMHPASVIAEELFGPRYTKRFAEIVQARTCIKHKDFESAKKLLNGKLERYLTDESQAKGLAGALKIVVNSVYGLTSASFPNPFRDPKNRDNIVAKRGALFMVNLKHEVQRRGYTVVHIKTDSIKVERATPEIVQFIRDYGKLYGYSFETEAEYDRLCLVNNAVYIAHEKTEGWTATGAQFQQPYVFKTLFSGEPIEFDDLCETKSVSGGVIFLDMNENLRSQEDAEIERDRRIYNLAHPDKMKKLNPEFAEFSDEELNGIIASAHNYQFVGRVGLFAPIKPGRGGGVMYRFKDGKYYSVTGTKGYRWLEAETVQNLKKQNDIDTEYHQHLVDEAIAEIERFGSFEKFIDLSKPYEVDISEDDDPPWSELPPVVPCGDGKYNSCLECPNCKDDLCKKGYSLASYIEYGGDGK